MWEVEYTDQFERWWETLSEREQDAVAAAVAVLEQKGPGLGRPLVDTLQGTRLPNLKELRPPAGNLRVLFAFDPRRVAILLLGGDKTDQWESWYEGAIPAAEQLFEEHLALIAKEGELPERPGSVDDGDRDRHETETDRQEDQDRD